MKPAMGYCICEAMNRANEQIEETLIMQMLGIKEFGKLSISGGNCNCIDLFMHPLTSQSYASGHKFLTVVNFLNNIIHIGTFIFFTL